MRDGLELVGARVARLREDRQVAEPERSAEGRDAALHVGDVGEQRRGLALRDEPFLADHAQVRDRERRGPPDDDVVDDPADGRRSASPFRIRSSRFPRAPDDARPGCPARASRRSRHPSSSRIGISKSRSGANQCFWLSKTISSFAIRLSLRATTGLLRWSTRSARAGSRYASSRPSVERYAPAATSDARERACTSAGSGVDSSSQCGPGRWS